MQLGANVFDVWAFRRDAEETKYLLFYTSQVKADRYFNGGRFWQIPSGVVENDESIESAIQRLLNRYGLDVDTIWAAEHAYMIYNRRFRTMQAISVYAAEVPETPVPIESDEHSEYGWYSLDESLQRVHYRGLKDGLRSVHEYVTGTTEPARELCLFERL